MEISTNLWLLSTAFPSRAITCFLNFSHETRTLCCEQGPCSPSLPAITLSSLIYTTILLQGYLEYLWYPEMQLNTGWFFFLLYFYLQLNSQVSSLFSMQLSTSLLKDIFLFFLFFTLLHLFILLLPVLNSFPNLQSFELIYNPVFHLPVAKFQLSIPTWLKGIFCWVCFNFLALSLTWEFTFGCWHACHLHS